MNTEITEYKIRGWVLYDGECRLCTDMARRFHHLLAGRHLELLPLQTPWVKARLGLPDDKLLAEMRLLRPDGRYFGGADAVLEVGRYFWWAWPLRALGRIPVVKHILRAVYRWVARNRNCTTSACEIKRQTRAMCAFMAVFWTIRLIAATFIFDVRPYLTNNLWRLGYHATNIVFIYLPIIYAWAALRGGNV